MNLPRKDIYPDDISYTIESTPEEDRRLLALWRYMNKNGPNWNPGYNCVVATMQFRNYGIDPPPKEPPYDPANTIAQPDSSPAGVREQARRLNLAWERADTVGEHLDVVGELVGGIARDAKNDFLTFIGLGD